MRDSLRGVRDGGRIEEERGRVPASDGHDAASQDVRFDQACARVFGRFDVDCIVPIVVTSVTV